VSGFRRSIRLYVYAVGQFVLVADRLSLEAILGGVAAVRVPQFAVRLVMLAVLCLLTGVVAQVAPAAAAVRTGSPGTAASFAVSGYLSDVAATSASNAWAVGYTGSGTLIVRWNGAVWKRVPSPGSAGSLLYGVAATSSRDAWAVGCTDCSGSGVSKTLILRWDGSAWKRVSSPSPGSDATLEGVAASSAGSAWAVGSTISGSSDNTLIERWNGTAWTRVPSPNPDANQGLLPTQAIPSTSCVFSGGRATANSVLVRDALTMPR
jgi:hypothetical protein